MAVAMAYPEPEKGGRGKKNSFATQEFSDTAISRARTVLRKDAELAAVVLAGGMSAVVLCRLLLEHAPFQRLT